MHRLALQLKLALENSGYSRNEICEQCDIAPATLSKYINGKMQPRKDALSRLMKVIPEDYIGAVYTAYLKDLLPTKGEQYISISENSQPRAVKETPAEYNAPKLPKELEEAFAELRALAGKSTLAAEFVLATSEMMKEAGTERND